jgi:hypothetical protein
VARLLMRRSSSQGRHWIHHGILEASSSIDTKGARHMKNIGFDEDQCNGDRSSGIIYGRRKMKKDVWWRIRKFTWL